LSKALLEGPFKPGFVGTANQPNYAGILVASIISATF